jgi:hypothetical protein
MFKIIGVDQKEYGPISADLLRQWIAEGRVNGHTRVLPEGATAWKTMAELPEFAAVLPPPVPPVATIQMGGPPPPAGTSQMAVWSLVAGIASLLCCQFYIGVVSIILGAVALGNLKRNPQMQGRGFAVAGIALGIVALLMFVVLLVVMISSPELFKNLPNAFQQ